MKERVLRRDLQKMTWIGEGHIGLTLDGRYTPRGYKCPTDFPRRWGRPLIPVSVAPLKLLLPFLSKLSIQCENNGERIHVPKVRTSSTWLPLEIQLKRQNGQFLISPSNPPDSYRIQNSYAQRTSHDMRHIHPREGA